MADLTCCVCSSTMSCIGPGWCFRCPECGTQGSTLEPGINDEHLHEVLDERSRETGLAALRSDNLAEVVSRLLSSGLPMSGRVLDVGSAHGWFLQAAASRGLRAEGVEPDVAVATMAGGMPVRIGYFPDVLEPDEQFDAITFNDVLEHLPRPDEAIDACVQHLSPGGIISVNIPTSDGLMFRLAGLLRRVGVAAISERLWQVGLPSPHLWYFSRAGLIRLGQDHGLEVVASRALDSVRRSGLWQRAHADRRPTLLTVVGFVGVWLAAPLLNARAVSDIMHVTFRASSPDQVSTVQNDPEQAGS